MSVLDRLRGWLDSGDEPEEEDEVVEPNPLEGDVLAGGGLEVNELVSKIASDRGVSRVEAARGLYRALDEGRVSLVDLKPPGGVFGYLFSLHSLWFWLVSAFLVVLSVSIYVMPQIYPLVYLRYAVGALFVLYVPGYALIEALYPKRGELDRLERLALGIGLSLALVPLVGLVLNYTPWGIRLDPILSSLCLLTLGLGLAGVYRKYGFWVLGRTSRVKR